MGMLAAATRRSRHLVLGRCQRRSQRCAAARQTFTGQRIRTRAKQTADSKYAKSIPRLLRTHGDLALSGTSVLAFGAWTDLA